MWKLPLNAAGVHELILAVHTDGDKFCYHYDARRVGADSRTHDPRASRRTFRDSHRQRHLRTEPRRTRSSTGLPPACRWRCRRRRRSLRRLPEPHDQRSVHAGHRARYEHALARLRRTGLGGERLLIDAEHPDARVRIRRDDSADAAAGNVYLSSACCTVRRTLQVAVGLDGVWIVEPDAPQLPRSAEHVVMLRYRIPFVLDNNFAPDETAFFVDAVAHEAARPAASPVPYDPFDPPAWPITYPMNAGGVVSDPSGCNGLGSEVKLAAERLGHSGLTASSVGPAAVAAHRKRDVRFGNPLTVARCVRQTCSRFARRPGRCSGLRRDRAAAFGVPTDGRGHADLDVPRRHSRDR